MDKRSDLLHFGPPTLERICTKTILCNVLLNCGQKIEEKAKIIFKQDTTTPKRRRKSSTTILTENLLEDDPDDYLEFFTQTEHFKQMAGKCRDYLKTHLSSCTLDSLVHQILQMKDQNGFSFALSSLSSDRLTCLPIKYLTLPSHLILECISHLANLVSLTLHALANNIMLHLVAETCTKLQILDISYSTDVTDLGLLYLCGGSRVTIER